MIRAEIDRASQLTTFTCRGALSAAAIGEQIKTFYQSEQPTRYVLWDLTQADVTALKHSDIQALAQFVRSQWHSRDGGKTALVAPPDVTFGLGRMYQSLVDFPEEVAEIRVFRSPDEARQWLGV